MRLPSAWDPPPPPSSQPPVSAAGGHQRAPSPSSPKSSPVLPLLQGTVGLFPILWPHLLAGHLLTSYWCSVLPSLKVSPGARPLHVLFPEPATLSPAVSLRIHLVRLFFPPTWKSFHPSPKLTPPCTSPPSRQASLSEHLVCVSLCLLPV